MTSRNITVGEAELEIMKVIWAHDEPINTLQISEAVEERGWKRTTISTFLTRLVEKGALSSEKRGKQYYCSALISKEEYTKSQTGNLIKNLFGGSIKAFAASLFESSELSDDDIRELKAIIGSKEEK